MKLQVALDQQFQQSLRILEAVHPYVGIAEIGTPLVFREGVAAIQNLRRRFPALTLLADFKIMDAGDEEAGIAFEAGADIVTVLGVTQDSTVRGVAAAARRAGRQVMADLMQVQDKAARGRELLHLGCDYLCVHTAFDAQHGGGSPLADLEHLRHQLGEAAPLAVAGGISLQTIGLAAALRPEIIVVGGAITSAADPAATARALRERIQTHAAL